MRQNYNIEKGMIINFLTGTLLRQNYKETKNMVFKRLFNNYVANKIIITIIVSHMMWHIMENS